MRFGWMQVGDHIQERFAIDNGSIIPALWIKIIDHSQMPGYSASIVWSVRSKWHSHWFTRGVCNRRGIYTLGPTSIETVDPLGIFTIRIHYSETVTMMVVPSVVPLRRLGYPLLKDEVNILDGQQFLHPIDELEPVFTVKDVLEVNQALRSVHIAPKVKRYIVDLVQRTRDHKDIYLGASPRGSLGLFRAGQAVAAIQGRDYVTPDDIKKIAEPYSVIG